MNEISARELLAAIAYSDLKDCQVAIRLGNRYIVGSISSIEVAKEAGLVTRFQLEGIVLNDS